MSLSFVQNRTHCLLCKNTYETRGAMKHLRACLRKQPDPPPDSRPPTMVSVHGDHPDKNNAYAVYLVFEHGSTLSDLDIYLRATWLECCFHLSLFRDLDTLYLCPEWPPEPICEPNIQFMHTPISNAIAPGDQASYHYDLADPTDLTVRVHPTPLQALSALNAINPGYTAAMLMRNVMPELCLTCQQPANLLDENGYSCTGCSTDDDPRMLVNSPRDNVPCFDESTGVPLTLALSLLRQREPTHPRDPHEHDQPVITPSRNHLCRHRRPQGPRPPQTPRGIHVPILPQTLHPRPGPTERLQPHHPRRRRYIFPN